MGYAFDFSDILSPDLSAANAAVGAGLSASPVAVSIDVAKCKTKILVSGLKAY